MWVFFFCFHFLMFFSFLFPSHSKTDIKVHAIFFIMVFLLLFFFFIVICRKIFYFLHFLLVLFIPEIIFLLHLSTTFSFDIIIIIIVYEQDCAEDGTWNLKRNEIKGKSCMMGKFCTSCSNRQTRADRWFG